MGFLGRLLSRKERTERPVPKAAHTRAPGVCYECGKLLAAISRGVHSGEAMRAALDRSAYPCKSCGTDFCIDCMAKLRKRGQVCPYCLRDVGW